MNLPLKFFATTDDANAWMLTGFIKSYDDFLGFRISIDETIRFDLFGLIE